MERQGRSYVAWEDERNGPTDAYGCLLDEAGRPVGSNRRLNDDPPAGPGQYYCAVGAGDGRFVVAWTDARAGLDIYGQFLDGAGQPVGPNFRANSDTGGAYQWYPYCAMDSLNRAVVVWMDTRGGPFQYYGRLYDAAGNPAGPEFAVQDSTAHGYYGSAAMNRAGRFVVAWMDYRDGDESNVYCQVFRPDGSRVGSNFRVNTDPGRNYQGYPACAIDGSGRSAVAWEDTRNGNYDVYVQWFDSTGTPLGDNERLNDGATAADCYSPTCAFAPDGRLAVMFNDERETPGNPQIFCQRFRADRTRDGLNRKVNNPNLFPHNHHWTVGQSIAASLDRLAFAWTENRRHLGWDIFAKLTDWNLVGIEEPRGRPAGGRRQRVPTVVRRGSRVRVRGAAGPALRLFDACGRLARTWPAVRPEVEADLAGLGGGAYFLVDDSGALLGRIAVD